MSPDISQHYQTVVQLLKYKNAFLSSLLSKGEFDNEVTSVYDEWNDEEIYSYRVILRLSVDDFVHLKSVQDEFDKAEKDIVEAFEDCIGRGGNIRIMSASILAAQVNFERDVVVKDFSYWTAGYYRIFISHLSGLKKSAALLKGCLEEYAISCFVAHEDIKPSREWEQEIEKALCSMDALCAIISEGFHESKWCDQEVGWALGRNVLFIPIGRNAMPYGFMEKYQAIKAQPGDDTRVIAKSVFDVVCESEKSRDKYLSVLTNVLLASKNVTEANKWIEVLGGVPSLQRFELQVLHRQAGDSIVLMRATVLPKLNALFAKVGLPEVVNAPEPVAPSWNTDDLPF